MSQPTRTRLPDDRAGINRKFKLHYHDEHGHPAVLSLYLIANADADGKLREVFIRADKQGGFLSGALSLIAAQISIALQYDVPLSVMIARMKHNRFGPAGFTGDPEFPSCSSPFDLLAQWLEARFLPKPTKRAE